MWYDSPGHRRSEGSGKEERSYGCCIEKVRESTERSEDNRVQRDRSCREIEVNAFLLKSKGDLVVPSDRQVAAGDRNLSSGTVRAGSCPDGIIESHLRF